MKSLHTILATALLAATIAGCGGESSKNGSGAVPVAPPSPSAGNSVTASQNPPEGGKPPKPETGSSGSKPDQNPSPTSPSTNTPPAPTASATTPPPSEEPKAVAKDQKSERPKSGANGGEVK